MLVLITSNHAQCPGLRLLDLDGRYLRTIAAGRFRRPQAVAASHGRVFVVDKDPIRHVLHVIDIHSGDILQQVRFDLVGEITAVLLDGDEIYIAGFRESTVVVLPFAGSEA